MVKACQNIGAKEHKAQVLESSPETSCMLYTWNKKKAICKNNADKQIQISLSLANPPLKYIQRVMRIFSRPINVILNLIKVIQIWKWEDEYKGQLDKDVNQPFCTLSLEAQSLLPCTISQMPGAQPAITTAGLIP